MSHSDDPQHGHHHPPSAPPSVKLSGRARPAAPALPRPPTLRLSGVAVISVQVFQALPFQVLLELLRVVLGVQRVQAMCAYNNHLYEMA